MSNPLSSIVGIPAGVYPVGSVSFEQIARRLPELDAYYVGLSCSDAAKLQLTLAEIYNDESLDDLFYVIMKYYIQEHAFDKLLTALIVPYWYDRAWPHYDVLMTWAWDYEHYDIFGFMWYAYYKLSHQDETTLTLDVPTWPSELAEVFELLNKDGANLVLTSARVKPGVIKKALIKAFPEFSNVMVNGLMKWYPSIPTTH